MPTIRRAPCRLALAAWLAAASLVAGCASETQYPSAAIPAARLPTFEVGDAFSFDDGRTEKVLEIDGDRVRWSSGPDFRFATYRNILLPRLAWQSDAERGERSLDAKPDALWPLAEGRTVTLHYRERVSRDAAGSSDEHEDTMTCEVAGTAVVPTRAGTFDTYRVVCRRQSGLWLVPYAAERTFFYAPALRYYVRREDRRPGEATRVLQLTDFRTGEPALPRATEARRRKAVQSTLETELSGERQAWQAPDRKTSGTIEPLRTFRNAAGRFCRIYVEQISSGGSLYRFDGEACRLADARWHAVRPR